MWGKRRKRGAQLPRQLALGLLEDAMGRIEQPQADEPEEAAPYPGVVPPLRAAPPERAGRLLPGDVPVDCSAGPSAADEPPPPPQLPAKCTGDSTRHGSLG